MVRQWLIVCNSSTSTDSFSHQCQYLSLYYTGRIMISGCLGVTSLQYIVVLIRNGTNICVGMGQLGFILCNVNEVACSRCGWSILLVFWNIIEHLSNVVYHLEYYVTRRGVVNDNPEVLMHFSPHDGNFRNIPILQINVSKDTRNSGRVNMWCIQVIGMT